MGLQLESGTARCQRLSLLDRRVDGVQAAGLVADGMAACRGLRRPADSGMEAARAVRSAARRAQRW